MMNFELRILMKGFEFNIQNSQFKI